MVRAVYKQSDFDFALVYVEKLDLFYVFGYSSEIHLVESDNYRNAWKLTPELARREETDLLPTTKSQTEQAIQSSVVAKF